MAIKPNRSFTDRLKDKYRLIIYNDNTFEEVGYIRLKGFNLLWILGALAFLLIAITFSIIAYTSLKELLPGYPDVSMKRNIVMNSLRLDSLQHEIEMRDMYLHNIKRIISGEDMNDTISLFSKDSTLAKKVKFKKSESDSLLREEVEKEDKYNITANANVENTIKYTPLSHTLFFPPIKGTVTNSFMQKSGHFGTDIVAKPNEVIKATLAGTIIISNWTIETGYTMQIQHENNLISVYKHNSELLKKEGDQVKAGEVIAIIGNSGEVSTGPHLHFELWHNGHAINPEDYIVF